MEGRYEKNFKIERLGVQYRKQEVNMWVCTMCHDVFMVDVQFYIVFGGNEILLIFFVG